MQELQLDPYTFSPQLAVQLGTLKSVNGETAIVQRMERYEAEEEDLTTGLEPELVITLSDLQKDAGKYKIVKHST